MSPDAEHPPPSEAGEGQLLDGPRPTARPGSLDDELPREGRHGAHSEHHLLRESGEDRWRWRAKIRRNPLQLRVYRFVVGFVGLFFVALGFVSGPLPGPGGIPLVLLGLAIWSSEFVWAQHLMAWFKLQLHRFRSWSRLKQTLRLDPLLRLLRGLRLQLPARAGCARLDAGAGAGRARQAARGLTADGSSRLASWAGPAVDNGRMRAAEYEYFSPPFLALAHRGGARYAPNLHRENTRHAFQQAADLGYRYFETDVHATADGVLLAFHDDKLDRVTDRHGVIAELPYAAVAAARIHGVDPVPRLDELLTAFPDARFNIDAKSPAAVDLLADTIAEHEAGHRVCVSSFGVGRLHRLRRRLGRSVPSSASAVGVAANRFLPWLTRALNTPAPALQIPIRHLFGSREVTLLTPELIRSVHRAGKHVHVWTVDDPATIARLLDLGVDGIFTDRIDTLKHVLTEHGRWV